MSWQREVSTIYNDVRGLRRVEQESDPFKLMLNATWVPDMLKNDILAYGHLPAYIADMGSLNAATQNGVKVLTTAAWFNPAWTAYKNFTVKKKYESVGLFEQAYVDNIMTKSNLVSTAYYKKNYEIAKQTGNYRLLAFIFAQQYLASCFMAPVPEYVTKGGNGNKKIYTYQTDIDCTIKSSRLHDPGLYISLLIVFGHLYQLHFPEEQERWDWLQEKPKFSGQPLIYKWAYRSVQDIIKLDVKNYFIAATHYPAAIEEATKKALPVTEPLSGVQKIMYVKVLFAALSCGMINYISDFFAVGTFFLSDNRFYKNRQDHAQIYNNGLTLGVDKKSCRVLPNQKEESALKILYKPKLAEKQNFPTLGCEASSLSFDKSKAVLLKEETLQPTAAIINPTGTKPENVGKLFGIPYYNDFTFLLKSNIPFWVHPGAISTAAGLYSNPASEDDDPRTSSLLLMYYLNLLNASFPGSRPHSFEIGGHSADAQFDIMNKKSAVTTFINNLSSGVVKPSEFQDFVKKGFSRKIDQAAAQQSAGGGPMSIVETIAGDGWLGLMKYTDSEIGSYGANASGDDKEIDEIMKRPLKEIDIYSDANAVSSFKKLPFLYDNGILLDTAKIISGLGAAGIKDVVGDFLFPIKHLDSADINLVTLPDVLMPIPGAPGLFSASKKPKSGTCMNQAKTGCKKSNPIWQFQAPSFKSAYGMCNLGFRIIKARIKAKQNKVPLLGAKNTDNLVQSFVIANNFLFEKNKKLVKEGISTKFFDSQLKFNANYAYAMTEICLRGAILYSYNIKEHDTAHIGYYSDSSQYRTFKIRLNQRPLTFIDENNILPSPLKVFPYFNLPPTCPKLEIYSYAGINNKLSLLFEDIVQGNKEKIVIKSIPSKYWEKRWEEAVKYYNTEHPVKLQASNVAFKQQPIEKILIYRQTRKPKSIYDFDTLYQTVRVAEQGRFIDNVVEPNQKYYYSIKTVNNIGLISYSSEAYEVELVDDGGSVIPQIKTVDFKLKDKKKKTKEFKRYLRIKPALLQAAPHRKTATGADIGYLTKSIFSLKDETSPKFKIRITSKKTGRKIDLNVLYRKHYNDPSLTIGNATLDEVILSYGTTPSGNVWGTKADCAEYRKLAIEDLLDRGEDPKSFFKSPGKPNGYNLYTVSCEVLMNFPSIFGPKSKAWLPTAKPFFSAVQCKEYRKAFVKDLLNAGLDPNNYKIQGATHNVNTIGCEKLAVLPGGGPLAHAYLYGPKKK